MSLSQETQVDFSADEIKIAYKIMQKEKMSRKIKFVEDAKKYFEEIKIENKTPKERTAEILRIKGEFEESYKNKMGQEEFKNNKPIIDKAFVNLNKIALNLNFDITTKIFTDEERSGNTEFEMMRMVNLVISLDRNKRLRDLAPRAIEVRSTMASVQDEPSLKVSIKNTRSDQFFALGEDKPSLKVGMQNTPSVQLPPPEEDDPSVKVGMNKTQDATTRITSQFRSSWLKKHSSGLPGTSGEVRDQAGLYGEFISKITKEEEEPESQISLTERQGKLKRSLEEYFNLFPRSHYDNMVKMKNNFSKGSSE
jgi:hypothetical protein